jgi:ribosome recycling factor
LEEFSIERVIADADRRMKGALDVLHKDMGGLRSGRASASLVEPIVVDAYGTQMPLTQVSTVGVPEARMITVQVWDRGLVKAVEKAIRDSDLGLNPSVDGQLLRLPVPALTEERRRDLTRVAGRYAEEARVAVRNVRRHIMDEFKRAEKEHLISQDQHRDYTDTVQKLTDRFVKEIDDLLATKESEIMQV